MYLINFNVFLQLNILLTEKHQHRNRKVESRSTTINFYRAVGYNGFVSFGRFGDHTDLNTCIHRASL